jgi:C4-dicarboxylate transporter, DctM subunit
MDPLVVAVLGIVAMFVLIGLQIPIGAAMAIAGFAAYAVDSGVGPAASLFGTETASALSNFELAVIPLFLLMGNFATAGGLSADIYRLAYALTGHRRGGLALSTVLGCAGFGAVCGSSVATAATMTTVALPEMRKRGYRPSLATGCIAAGGTLGILIPPSIIMVLYAIQTEQFIITLFVAAIVPGLVAVTLHALAIATVVHVDPEAGPAGPRMGWRERLSVLSETWAVLFLAAIVAGGIYGGVFTVTEAAAVGAAVAFLFALGRGRLTRPAFMRALVDTASTTGMIYLILIGANVFSYFITASQLPDAVVEAIRELDAPPLLVVTLLLAMYFVLGAIFETVSAMLITLPFVFPLVTGLGYDPVWWGIINVMVIEIGMITPPIGLNVFVVHGMARDIPMRTVFAGIVPFLTADVVRLAILVLFPGLTLWLPGLMG